MKESLYRMKNWIINAGAINACRESYATNFLYFSDIFLKLLMYICQLKVSNTNLSEYR